MDIFLFWNIFFNNDEENNNDWEIAHRRERHLKINNFFENVALVYSLTGNNKTILTYYLFFIISFIIVFLHYFIIDFKSHFRINRNTFEYLIQTFGAALLENNPILKKCPKLSPSKQLAIAVWFFGNQEVYRFVIKTFDFSVLLYNNKNIIYINPFIYFSSYFNIIFNIKIYMFKKM
ncbi:uncharacterized protein [Linepithema humile]|uniref:uncharacterized protein n=1 Tax=Linepithema humile TaxID=83485 RepID=UPI00351DD82F